MDDLEILRLFRHSYVKVLFELGWVSYYDVSIRVGYLMPNHLYTYKLDKWLVYIYFYKIFKRTWAYFLAHS